MARTNQINFAGQGQLAPTPQQVQRLQLAQALQQQGSSGAPVQHPYQGWNRVAQALTGAWDESQVEKEQKERQKAYQSDLSRLLAGSQARPEQPLGLDDTGQPMAGPPAPATPGGLAGVLGVSNLGPDAQGIQSQLALSQILAGPKEEKLYTVDGALVTPGGEVRYKGEPKPDKPTLTERMMALAGIDANSPEGQAMARKILEGKARGQSINVDARSYHKGEDAAAGEAGKLHARRFDEVVRAGDAAFNQQEQLDVIKNIDVSTGWGVNTRAKLAAIINGLGGNGNALLDVDPANVQAFNAATMDQVNKMLRENKGPQTEGDAIRARATMASIDKEEDANKFILSMLTALNMRRMEMRNFFLEQWRKGASHRDIEIAWDTHKHSTPMVSESKTDPATGLPIFYYEFRKEMLAENPAETEDRILSTWRKFNGAGK